MPRGMVWVRETGPARQRWRVAASCAVLALFCGTATWPAPAAAESLSEALATAYRENPRLDAERARLRATDEDVARAVSGYRPQIGASAEIARETTSSKPAQLSDGTTDPWAYSINLSQPIFSGFRTTNDVNQAEADVRAGRENLRRVEAETLLDAVEAYVDVVRDGAILKIRERNVEVLSQELDAAETRRAAREVTRTDVAQAEARRARAISEADRARANLKVSKARYQQVIGRPPQNVSGPSLKVKGLPKSLTDALDIAGNEAPNVLSALHREASARFNVDKIWGEMLPQVSLDASYSQTGDSSGYFATEDEGRIAGRVSIPLYEGGEVRARVRQAKHTHVSRLQEIEQARQETEANVTAAWSRLTSARAQMKSDDVQVEASRTALEGTREEERVGQRTLLDVLNAEQEFLEAQVQAVATKRDVVVASYAVLSEIGRLNGENLNDGSLVYDPEEHYREARDEWISTDITYRSVGAPRHAEADEWNDRDMVVGEPVIERAPPPPRPAPPNKAPAFKPALTDSAADDTAADEDPAPPRLRPAQD